MKTRFCVLISAFLFVSAGGAIAASKPVPLIQFYERASEALDIQIEDRDTGNTLVDAPDLKGMSPDEARKTFHAVLALEGLAAVYDDSLDLYRIMRQRDARDLAIPLVTDFARLPDDDRMVIARFKLAHAPADAVARTLRSFAPANSRLIPDDANSAITVTDSARSMRKYQQLIAAVDDALSAKEARREVAARAEKPCPDDPLRAPVDVGSFRLLLTALFAVIGLLVGFIARGYVIRRIEGGL